MILAVAAVYKRLPFGARLQFVAGVRNACPYGKRLQFLFAICEATEFEFDRAIDLTIGQRQRG